MNVFEDIKEGLNQAIEYEKNNSPKIETAAFKKTKRKRNKLTVRSRSIYREKQDH